MDEKLFCVSLQSNDFESFWYGSDHSLCALINQVELAICDDASILVKKGQILKVFLVMNNCLNGSYSPFVIYVD